MSGHITNDEWNEIKRTGVLKNNLDYGIKRHLHKKIATKYNLPFDSNEKLGIYIPVRVQLSMSKGELLAGSTPYRAINQEKYKFIDGFDKLSDSGLLRGRIFIIPGIALPEHMTTKDVIEINNEIFETESELCDELKEAFANGFESTPILIGARDNTITGGESSQYMSVNFLIRPVPALMRYEQIIRKVLPVINNNSSMLYIFNIGYVENKFSGEIVAEKLKNQKIDITVSEEELNQIFKISEPRRRDN